MAIEKNKFGTLPNGKDVYQYTLTNAKGMQLSAINYGGIITSILAPDKKGALGDIVLGFETLDDYINDTHYIGAIVGRNANRIANAQFELDGQIYKLAKNNGNNNHHGGLIGFNKVFWNIEPLETVRGSALIVTYTSVDSEEGFPGNLSVKVIYTLTPNNKVIIEYQATTDKKTVFNPTQHLYFNLSAGKSDTILGHELQIDAKQFLPSDANQVPTGEFRYVNETVFDFLESKPIGKDILEDDEQLNVALGFDQTWVIDNPRKLPIVQACTLFESESNRSVKIFTSEPGIQVYTGNYLNGSIGKNDVKYTKHYGIGLETQHFPNSPNTPTFPSVVLDVDQKFYSTTMYLFEN
jgi:aldose 1-epimerase